MTESETARPRTEHGFALRHPYGTSTVLLVFVAVIVGQDLTAAYGSTTTRHPYTLAIPFLGLVCFWGLGFWLAILAGGDTESETVDSFLPIYTFGVSVWFGVTLAIELLVPNPVSAAAAGVAAVLVAAHTLTVDIEFAKPESLSLEVPRWTTGVIVTNAVLLAAILTLYHGILPIWLTPLTVVVYLLATAAYPFALFTNAYGHAESAGRSWQYPVAYGCLAIGALMTIGVANWLITLVYTLHRTADSTQ